jgi:hypothetical protein
VAEYVSIRRRGARLTVLAGCGALLLAGAGCGRRAVERYDVSGTVTFDGRPVPVGQIMFQPDTSKGNRGPAGVAKIENGRFDTSKSDKGTVGGPHVVTITGFDNKDVNPDEELPVGMPLFPEYRTTVDLPKEDTTQQFDVPKAGENLDPAE